MNKIIFMTASAALALAPPAYAQDANANAASQSNSGSQSASQVGSNVQATGQSASVSQSASDSTSSAGALGNVTNVVQDFSTPSEQTINSNIDSMSRSVSESTINATNTQRYEGSYSVKTVASAIAPNINPSAVCMGSISAAGGFLGFGLSGGGSYTDKECALRENARILGQLGMVAGAVSLMCTIEEVMNSMRGQCEEAMFATSREGVERQRELANKAAQQKHHADPVAPSPPTYISNPVVQPIPSDECAVPTGQMTQEQYDRCAEKGG